MNDDILNCIQIRYDMVKGQNTNDQSYGVYGHNFTAIRLPFTCSFICEKMRITFGFNLSNVITKNNKKESLEGSSRDHCWLW